MWVEVCDVRLHVFYTFKCLRALKNKRSKFILTCIRQQELSSLQDLGGVQVLLLLKALSVQIFSRLVRYIYFTSACDS